MEKLQIDVTKRDVTGKKVRYLRREGKTPASLYGHGVESLALQTDTKLLKQILQKAGETDLISLKIAGKKESVNVLVREVQKEPLSDQLLHVDFYQVDMSHKIKANVPLVFIGEAPVLKKKNVSIIHLMDSLHIEALPDQIPHNVEIDLTGLVELDSAIYVKNVNMGSDVTLLNDPEQIIAKPIEAKKEAEVVEAKAEVTEEAAAGEEAGAEKAEGAAEAGK